MTIEMTPHGVRLRIHLQPGASRNEAAGLHGDRLKIRIMAPPVDGKANQALIDWLADQLAVPARSVRLVRGDTSRAKDLIIEGTSVEAVRLALGLY